MAYPHKHHYESKLDWTDGNIWSLEHIPDQVMLRMVKVVGGVTSFPQHLIDYWVIGDTVFVNPAPADDEAWYFWYSYCQTATLEGVTFFVSSDPDNDPIDLGEDIPSGSVIEYSDGGSAGFAGGTTAPFFGPTGAAGTVTTVTITRPDGTKKVITFLVATLYLHDSITNKIHKIINNKAPLPLVHPTLVGPTYCRVAPSNPDVVYAFDIGTKSNSNIYKSTDGGNTWSTVELVPGNTDSRIIGVGIIDPNDPLIVYVPQRKQSGAIESAVYKTTNGGTTWTAMVPARNMAPWDESCTLAMHPEYPSRLLVATDGALSEVYLTMNGGATWTVSYTATSGSDVPKSTAWTTGIAYAFISTRFVPFHLRRSTDGGATFSNAVVYQDMAAGISQFRTNSDGVIILNKGDIIYHSSGGGAFSASAQGGTALAVSATAPKLFMAISSGLTGGNHATTVWSVNGSTWNAHQVNTGKNWTTLGIV